MPGARRPVDRDGRPLSLPGAAREQLVIDLALPAMTFVIHDTGALAVCSPWLPWLRFTRAFLASADGRRVILRGDEVEIRCSNGGALYALGALDDEGVRAGQLLRAWGPWAWGP
mgnify:CR=1 FL=1